MTLQEIAKLDREFLVPAEAAQILGCDQQDLRVQAKRQPERLGFPVCVVGTRVKIPRRPFLKFMTGEEV